MFPWDALSQSVPAHYVAGRFGIEMMGLLVPKVASLERDTFRLMPYAMLSGLANISALFERPSPTQVTRMVLRDNALIFRLQGQFSSTDELSAMQVQFEKMQTLIDVVFTRYENQDGDPAPRDLYLLLGIEIGNQSLRRMKLQFSGRMHDFNGNETPLAGTIAAPQIIEVQD